jgi:hypothetical protein
MGVVYEEPIVTVLRIDGKLMTAKAEVDPRLRNMIGQQVRLRNAIEPFDMTSQPVPISRCRQFAELSRTVGHNDIHELTWHWKISGITAGLTLIEAGIILEFEAPAPGRGPGCDVDRQA